MIRLSTELHYIVTYRIMCQPLSYYEIIIPSLNLFYFEIIIFVVKKRTSALYGMITNPTHSVSPVIAIKPPNLIRLLHYVYNIFPLPFIVNISQHRRLYSYNDNTILQIMTYTQ